LSMEFMCCDVQIEFVNLRDEFVRCVMFCKMNLW
jgi:hypothetical protein